MRRVNGTAKYVSRHAKTCLPKKTEFDIPLGTICMKFQIPFPKKNIVNLSSDEFLIFVIYEEFFLCIFSSRRDSSITRKVGINFYHSLDKFSLRQINIFSYFHKKIISDISKNVSIGDNLHESSNPVS